MSASEQLRRLHTALSPDTIQDVCRLVDALPEIAALVEWAEERAAIEEAGGRILTCAHAFGGVGRAIRRKLGTYQVDEVMAFTLRLLCDGVKVACEITMMATETGLIPAR